MTAAHRDPDPPRAVAANRRLAEAAHLQAIEGKPLTPDELAMFEMFEREGWSPEDRRAYIERQIRSHRRIAPAE
ncbi:MAG: hypothetical protein OXF79_24710 [Chloroflexi bacterium]|nr:hypothetical protein [Chloroflexota bacterium]